MDAGPANDSAALTPGHHPGVRSRRGLARLIGLALAVACALPLVIGAWLRPHPAGMGTHRALGLPPCGFLMATGRPCMTCGMTTAVALAARGRLLESARVQPAGAVVSVLLASGLIAGLHALATGSTLRPVLNVATSTRTLIVVGVILAAGWGYKVWKESAPALNEPGATATKAE